MRAGSDKNAGMAMESTNAGQRGMTDSLSCIGAVESTSVFYRRM